MHNIVSEILYLLVLALSTLVYLKIEYYHMLQLLSEFIALAKYAFLDCCFAKKHLFDFIANLSIFTVQNINTIFFKYDDFLPKASF